jgi:hypothetical protein
MIAGSALIAPTSAPTDARYGSEDGYVSTSPKVRLDLRLGGRANRLIPSGLTVVRS